MSKHRLVQNHSMQYMTLMSTKCEHVWWLWITTSPCMLTTAMSKPYKLVPRLQNEDGKKHMHYTQIKEKKEEKGRICNKASKKKEWRWKEMKEGDICQPIRGWVVIEEFDSERNILLPWWWTREKWQNTSQVK